MREKILATIETYAAGGTISAALEANGISKTPFYKMLRQVPEIMALYEAAIKVRGYVMLDEAYEIGSDEKLDPRSVRVMAEIRMKIAALNNPDRFGDRVNVQHEVKPDLQAAIEAGKRRAAIPTRDLAEVIDAEYSVVPPENHPATADKQSGDVSISPSEAAIDPFG